MFEAATWKLEETRPPPSASASANLFHASENARDGQHQGGFLATMINVFPGGLTEQEGFIQTDVVPRHGRVSLWDLAVLAGVLPHKSSLSAPRSVATFYKEIPAATSGKEEAF